MPNRKISFEEKSVQYYVQRAMKDARRMVQSKNPADAFATLSKTLDSFKTLPQTEVIADIMADARLSLGGICILLHKPQEAAQNYRKSLFFVRKLRNNKLALKAIRKAAANIGLSMAAAECMEEEYPEDGTNHTRSFLTEVTAILHDALPGSTREETLAALSLLATAGDWHLLNGSPADALYLYFAWVDIAEMMLSRRINSQVLGRRDRLLDAMDKACQFSVSIEDKIRVRRLFIERDWDRYTVRKTTPFLESLTNDYLQLSALLGEAGNLYQARHYARQAERFSKNLVRSHESEKAQKFLLLARTMVAEQSQKLEQEKEACQVKKTENPQPEPGPNVDTKPPEPKEASAPSFSRSAKKSDDASWLWAAEK